MANDVLRWRADSVDKVQQLAAVGVPGETVDGHHFTSNFHNFCFAVDEHGDFAEPFLKASSEGAFRLVADKAERIALFVGPVLEILHHGAAVQHARGGENDAWRAVHHDAFTEFPALDRPEPLAGERVFTVVFQQRLAQRLRQVVRVRGVDGGCFLDHSVKPHRDGFDRARPEQFVNGDHHFLTSTDGENGTDHLSTPKQGS